MGKIRLKICQRVKKLETKKKLNEANSETDRRRGRRRRRRRKRRIFL
jgi:hypothetical protein